MKVLHLHSGNLFGGVESFLLSLVRHPSDLKSEFALCFEGELSRRLAQLGVPVHIAGPVRLRNPRSVLRARSKLREVLAADGYDVVMIHSSWSRVVFGPVLNRIGIPIALWVHDAMDGKSLLDRLGARLPVGLVFCASEYLRRQQLPRAGAADVVVIPYPVDPPPDAPTIPAAETRRELGIPPEDVVLLQISRMEPWKGHEQLIEASARLAEIAGWQLLIVGGAQRDHEMRYLEGLVRRCEELGLSSRVRFLGQRSDVYEVLRAGDIFVQANQSPEPFGISFVEALYSGLPVVTAATGGGLEIVSSDCGVLFQPGDVNALAGALRDLIMNGALRRELGGHGPSRARDLCDPETQIRRISDALHARFPGGGT